MRTIHKQILKITATQLLKLPLNSTILFVANQHNNLCIWYECLNSNDLTSDRLIYIIGTGHEIPIDLRMNHLGSVLMAGDNLVWHVYEGLGQ